MNLHPLQIQNGRPSEFHDLLNTFKKFDNSVKYFKHSSNRLSKTEYKNIKNAITQITEKINTIINDLIDIFNNFDYRNFNSILIEKLSLITDSCFNNNQKCFKLNQIKQQVFANFISFLNQLKEKSMDFNYRTLINEMITKSNSAIECTTKNELNYIQELISEISYCNPSFDEVEELKKRSYEIFKLDFSDKNYQDLCDCCTKISNNKEKDLVEGFLLKIIDELNLREAVYDIQTSENDIFSDVTNSSANMYSVFSELVKDIGKAKTINEFFDRSEIILNPFDKLNGNIIKNAILTKILNRCKHIYCINFDIAQTQLSRFYIKI